MIPPRVLWSALIAAVAIAKPALAEDAVATNAYLDKTRARAHGSTASSDIGEVSAAIPLAELFVAAAPFGVPFHHWATTSCAVHPVGLKAMQVAAKVMGASLVDLLADPTKVAAAKKELVESTKGKPYVNPLAPDAKPIAF